MQTLIPPTAENIAIGLVTELCLALSEQKIVYCHWKSNAAINRSASGENDLDLLIARADKQRFIATLVELGFKLAMERPDHQLPGVLDYYGLDQISGRLVHVHAHFNLILGHDATKNYHIPIEDTYLASAYQNGIFMVPAPEYELLVLIIRLVLKHFCWDVWLLRQGKLSASEAKELEYLAAHSSRPHLEQILAEHLPQLKRGVFFACLKMCLSNSTTWEKLILGQMMVNSLDTYARRPKLIDSFLKVWRRFAWPIKKRIFRMDDRKRLVSGGLLVAIVGGDGAGKTTAVEGTFRWLSEDFEVRRFHMGKPAWSLLTILVRGFLKIGTALGFYPFQKAEILYTKDFDTLVFPGYPWLMREICTARDRYLTYLKARRAATNGGIVILDRFPLEQIQFMDGPQAERFTRRISKTNFLARLIQLEESYYRKIHFPDLLIVLRANPEIAMARKTDENSSEVYARSTEVWEIDWADTPAIVIDANGSRSQVLREVEGVLWSRL